MTRESRDLHGHVDRTGTAGCCHKQKHALTPTTSLHIVCSEQPMFNSDFQKDVDTLNLPNPHLVVFQSK